MKIERRTDFSLFVCETRRIIDTDGQRQVNDVKKCWFVIIGICVFFVTIDIVLCTILSLISIELELLSCFSMLMENKFFCNLFWVKADHTKEFLCYYKLRKGKKILKIFWVNFDLFLLALAQEQTLSQRRKSPSRVGDLLSKATWSL